MGIEYKIGNVTVQQLHEFGPHAKDAMGFLAAAIQLDQSKDLDLNDKMSAIDVNLKLWIGVKSLVADTRNQMPESLKEKIQDLSKYVSRRTLALGETMPDDALIDHFVNLNLQMSEGLLESGRASEG